MRHGVQVEVVTRTSEILADSGVLYVTWRASGITIRTLFQRFWRSDGSLYDVLSRDCKLNLFEDILHV